MGQGADKAQGQEQMTPGCSRIYKAALQENGLSEAFVSQGLAAGSDVTVALAAAIDACHSWNGWTLSPKAARKNCRTPTHTC